MNKYRFLTLLFLLFLVTAVLATASGVLAQGNGPGNGNGPPEDVPGNGKGLSNRPMHPERKAAAARALQKGAVNPLQE